MPKGMLLYLVILNQAQNFVTLLLRLEKSVILTYFSKDDFVFLISGANDIYSNEAKNFLRSVISILSILYSTYVIVSTTPTGHYLPSWSCVNIKIARTNYKVKKICDIFSNVSVLDVQDFDRSCFTRNGLHMSRRGKSLVISRLRHLVICKNKFNSHIIELPFVCSIQRNCNSWALY